MLTDLRETDSHIEPENQGFRQIGEILGGEAWLKYVKQGQGVAGEAEPDQPRAVHGRSGVVRSGAADKLAPRKRKKAKRGGWPETTYISHDLWKLTRNRQIEIQRAGYSWNIFITVRSPDQCSNDREAKAAITLEMARLGQSLERKGHPYIGHTVFEKPVGGRLHAHALLHVRKEQFKVIERWADVFDRNREKSRRKVEHNVPIHARFASRSDLDYILKEHRWCGKFERSRGWQYEKSEAIRGQRVSWTKAAMAIFGEGCNDIEEVEAGEAWRDLFDNLPEAVTPPKDHVLPPRHRSKLLLPGQLELALDRQPDVIDLMARLGSTHAEIAEKIGRSRAQTTNILNRQFGASRPVTRRVLELALAA